MSVRSYLCRGGSVGSDSVTKIVACAVPETDQVDKLTRLTVSAHGPRKTLLVPASLTGCPVFGRVPRVRFTPM